MDHAEKRDFVCDICGPECTFSSRNKLFRHIRQSHCKVVTTTELPEKSDNNQGNSDGEVIDKEDEGGGVIPLKVIYDDDWCKVIIKPQVISFYL